MKVRHKITGEVNTANLYANTALGVEIAGLLQSELASDLEFFVSGQWVPFDVRFCKSNSILSEV